MKSRLLHLAALTLSLALPICAHAQLREHPLAGPFEEPVALDPVKDLLPEYQTGPHHKITAPITTAYGHNQYVVESTFGTFIADGSLNLVQLTKELEAIARLRKTMQGEAYTAAVKKAETDGSDLAKKLVKFPVPAAAGIPGSPWKYLDRAAQAPAATPAKTAATPAADKALEAFAKAKREVAAAVGVDVYSGNPVLQQDLNSVAWAAAGSGTSAVAILGEAVVKPADGEEAIRAISPAEVRADAQAKLTKMGVAKEAVTAFLNNPAYSPTDEADFVTALEALQEASGRAELVRLATAAAEPADARFFVRSAQVGATLARMTPIKSVISHRGMPLYVSEDGVAFIPFEWDYACWTESAGQFIVSLKVEMFKKEKVTGFHVVITGVGTDRYADELMKRDLGFSDKGLTCPIKKEVKSGALPAGGKGQIASAR